MVLSLEVGRAAFLFGALAKNILIYCYYTKKIKIKNPSNSSNGEITKHVFSSNF